ncbi:hypothetical protein ACJW30_05G158400 [Castanea mollissima]
MMYTMDPYLVGNVASSMAESPPPITSRGLFLKMGAAPSHTAQADIPRFQNPLRPSPEPGKSKRLATTLVATMMELAMTILESVKTLKGVVEKSTLLIVSVRI